ncbi:hypothetical protein HDC92_004404 [Pedobacter sp. AK017]|uniref:hypothetical protein n=1 Tax=Pedobacter sp. AK017 TaxID=2723073 RepID=UPI00161FFA80|nr:hypothetical protein [Pedobacter sp. AK017]MBB5440701.1 hypothetical protein [Pedobacter sp. AK017]
MQQNSLWLSISLFCDREHWHTLLYKGIMPFVKGASAQLILDACQLEFNDTDGENIRLKLLANKNNSKLLTEKADRYFKQFFVALKLPFKEIQLPPDELFIPFPPNSIQYGLYTTASSSNLKNCQLETGLSDVMTEALDNQVIDEESIITLGFYLHVGLLKVLKHRKLDFAYKDVLQQYTGYASADTGQMYKEYQDSKEMLAEIYEDIMGQENYGNIPWLGKWMYLCEEELNRKTEASEHHLNNIIQNRFIFLIHTQLGINKYINFLLWYFIKQVVVSIDDDIAVNN